MTTEREDKILDLTEEWHNGLDDSANYDLPGWIAHKLDLTWGEAHWELYGIRTDGAML